MLIISDFGLLGSLGVVHPDRLNHDSSSQLKFSFVLPSFGNRSESKVER
jgi:hypothetical protein